MKTVKLIFFLLFSLGISPASIYAQNDNPLKTSTIQYIYNINHPLNNIQSFIPYTNKFLDIKRDIETTIQEEKVILSVSLKEQKKEIESEIKSEWTEFRETNWWLWAFFKESNSRKDLIRIKEILEEQKEIVKKYLSDEATLFDVYEIVWMLESFIHTEKKYEYNEYMHQKIDILKKQKNDIYTMKQSIKDRAIQLKNEIEQSSPEEDKQMIIARVKSLSWELPEEKREEFIQDFIAQINKSNSSFATEVAQEIQEEL